MSNNAPDYANNLVFPPNTDKLLVAKNALLNLRNIAEQSMDAGENISSNTVWKICNEAIMELEKVNNV